MPREKKLILLLVACIFHVNPTVCLSPVSPSICPFMLLCVSKLMGRSCAAVPPFLPQ
ncbi:hypothetical protein KP509_18G015800 [Ceratopteris richardii]|uniref:Uncharacterized protein n=1 Tax=Ceratopteris richardii TaxID=49495 RepID=A0A8T2SR19_CERRI|nr:hypothetical protein KP509_18G015800 [Ceratopteris richardii]